MESVDSNKELAGELLAGIDPRDALASAHEVLSWVSHVLWTVAPQHERALKPGSFRTSLLDAMHRADMENLGRIALGFPVPASLVLNYKEDGIGFLTGVIDEAEEMLPELEITAATADLLSEIGEVADGRA